MKRWLLERQLCIPRLVGWLVCLRGKNIDLPLKCSLLKSPLHLGTVQSQEPGSQSECPPWVPGTLSCLGRASGITNYLSEGTLAECRNQMQNPNCNPGTWTWDASISSVWTTSSNAPFPRENCSLNSYAFGFSKMLWEIRGKDRLPLTVK